MTARSTGLLPLGFGVIPLLRSGAGLPSLLENVKLISEDMWLLIFIVPLLNIFNVFPSLFNRLEGVLWRRPD